MLTRLTVGLYLLRIYLLWQTIEEAKAMSLLVTVLFLD